MSESASLHFILPAIKLNIIHASVEFEVNVWDSISVNTLWLKKKQLQTRTPTNLKRPYVKIFLLIDSKMHDCKKCLWCVESSTRKITHGIKCSAWFELSIPRMLSKTRFRKHCKVLNERSHLSSYFALGNADNTSQAWSTSFASGSLNKGTIIWDHT